MTNLDDLLKPTVEPVPPPQGRRLPWRVTSQFWVAFFGGVPAVTIIAFLNARRLGTSPRKQGMILFAGVLACIAFVVLMIVLKSMTTANSITRLAGRVVAVLLYLVLAQIQAEDDGRHQVFGSGQYASLWIPGILATVLSIVALLGFAMISLWLVS